MLDPSSGIGGIRFASLRTFSSRVITGTVLYCTLAEKSMTKGGFRAGLVQLEGDLICPLWLSMSTVRDPSRLLVRAY